MSNIKSNLPINLVPQLAMGEVHCAGNTYLVCMSHNVHSKNESPPFQVPLKLQQGVGGGMNFLFAALDQKLHKMAKSAENNLTLY